MFLIIPATVAQNQSPYISFALTSLSVLDNGSKLLLEDSESAKFVEFELFFSSAGQRIQTESGARHLMEHLIGYGKGGSLDQRLEAEGGWLELQTLRDGLSIKIDLPLDRWKDGFSYLREVITARDQWTPANIAGEKEMIQKESQLETPEYRMSQAAWTALYQSQAPDPLGKLPELQKVMADDVQKLADQTLTASRAALIIDGPLGLDTMRPAASGFLNSLPKGQELNPTARTPTLQIHRADSGSSGSARSCAIGSLASVQGMATLAAGLAVASQCKNGFASYVPSLREGAITVGSTDAGEVEKVIDSMDADDPARLYALGFNLAKQFLNEKFHGPDHCKWGALLLTQSKLARPSEFTKVLSQVGLKEFTDGLSQFTQQNGVEVNGQ